MHWNRLLISAWFPGFLLLLILMGQSACERPFVDPMPPHITVVSPDLSNVLLSPELIIQVRAEGIRSIEQVMVNGQAMGFRPDLNVWADTLHLQSGLNRLIFLARDIENRVGFDTTFAVHIPISVSSGPSLPEGRAGHTATLLSNGDLLVTGGVARKDGPALADAFLLPANRNEFVRLSQGLLEARTGHTATLLPDGTVLIAGGSRKENIQRVSDLVETVERYDPQTRRFARVRLHGQPIRRAFHTAMLRGTLLDLYGGEGDRQYLPDTADISPNRLGVRRDLRSFRLEGDSLTALHTIQSAFYFEDIAGHTQVPLSSLAPGQTGQWLVAGTFFSNQAAEQINFKLDTRFPPQFFITETPNLFQPRTRHAAALLSPGMVALFGGFEGNNRVALNHLEVYIDDLKQFLRFPPSTLFRRYGHTATKLPSGRILLLGGFAQSGNSLMFSEFFEAATEN